MSHSRFVPFRDLFGSLENCTKIEIEKYSVYDRKFQRIPPFIGEAIKCMPAFRRGGRQRGRGQCSLLIKDNREERWHGELLQKSRTSQNFVDVTSFLSYACIAWDPRQTSDHHFIRNLHNYGLTIRELYIPYVVVNSTIIIQFIILQLAALTSFVEKRQLREIPRNRWEQDESNTRERYVPSLSSLFFILAPSI